MNRRVTRDEPALLAVGKLRRQAKARRHNSLLGIRPAELCALRTDGNKLKLPLGYVYKWAGRYEFELRAKERLEFLLPIVFFVIFLLLYMVFHSVAEAAALIFPAFYALTGGLISETLKKSTFLVALLQPAGAQRSASLLGMTRYQRLQQAPKAAGAGKERGSGEPPAR